jgi:hypothetical protein
MPLKLSRYVEAIRKRAVVDAWDTSTSTLAPISYLEYLNSSVLAAATFAASTSYNFYIIPNDGKTWQVTGISYQFTTQATGAATFDVTADAAAGAAGSGTSLFGGTLTLQGTANTTINAVPTTQTVLTPGMKLAFKVGSTASTGLVGLLITVTIQRVS